MDYFLIFPETAFPGDVAADGGYGVVAGGDQHTIGARGRLGGSGRDCSGGKGSPFLRGSGGTAGHGNDAVPGAAQEMAYGRPDLAHPDDADSIFGLRHKCLSDVKRDG